MAGERVKQGRTKIKARAGKAQGRWNKGDKYRPFMKAKGPYKQDERWNLSKMQVLLILVVVLFVVLVIVPVSLCIGLVLIIIVMSVGGVKVFLHLIIRGTQVMIFIGKKIYRIIQLIWRAIKSLGRKFWPF